MIDKPRAAELGWTLLKTSYLYKSPWYDLRQDTVLVPESGNKEYTYVEHPGSVFVVPITEHQKVVLIRSYRYTIDEWCWEVPAGGLGDQGGASPEEVARRELRQEAGGACRQMERMGNYYLGNGHSCHRAHYFLATGVSLDRQQSLENLELIERVVTFSVQEVQRMLSRNLITDGDSAFALFLAMGLLRSAR